VLSRREHSARELAGKLRARGFSEEVVSSLVAELTEENLLSDQRFAEALVHVRSERGYGPARIARELRDKGVSEQIIADWVDERDPDWLARLRQLNLKKYGDAPPADAKERARRMRFLYARGFTAEQIRRVMDTDDWD
jgi:regulatory protein